MHVRTQVGMLVGIIALSLAVSTAQAQSLGDADPRGATICACLIDGSGADACGEGRDCDPAAACATNADCPTGSICHTDNCCDAPLNAGICTLECNCICIDGGTASGGSCNNFPLCDPATCIPAVSEWGLIVLTGLGLTVGTIVFRRRLQLRSA